MESALTPLTTNWHILGSSVVGTSHRKSGRGCDDAHAYKQLENGVLLLAVADGAGSATRSALGAVCAVQAALQAATYILEHQGEPENEERWRTVLTTVLEVVHFVLERLSLGEIHADSSVANDTSIHQTEFEDGQPQHILCRAVWHDISTYLTTTASSTLTEYVLEELASQKRHIQPLREFATTLLFTIVTSQWVAGFQIGDGAVVTRAVDGTLHPLTWPDHGEYVNETNFVTHPRYLRHAQYTSVSAQGIQGIALFTDGIEMLALDLANRAAYQPFFEPLFKFATMPEATEMELTTFLESERVCNRTDDDKTLVLAVCT